MPFKKVSKVQINKVYPANGQNDVFLQRFRVVLTVDKAVDHYRNACTQRGRGRVNAGADRLDAGKEHDVKQACFCHYKADRGDHRCEKQSPSYFSMKNGVYAKKQEEKRTQEKPKAGERTEQPRRRDGKQIKVPLCPVELNDKEYKKGDESEAKSAAGEEGKYPVGQPAQKNHVFAGAPVFPQDCLPEFIEPINRQNKAQHIGGNHSIESG